MSSLGKRIAENRKRRNLTQDQMAEALGVSNQAVSKWENDLSCPDISVLPELSDLLGVSIDVLLRGESVEVVKYASDAAEKGITERILKVRIVDEDTKVSLNLPLALCQIGLDMSSMNISSMKGVDLKNVDFNAIVELASKGVVGKILEIEEENGTHCELWVE